MVPYLDAVVAVTVMCVLLFVLDVCFGCGGVSGEWVGVWTRVWRGGLCRCESGFSV